MACCVCYAQGTRRGQFGILMKYRVVESRDSELQQWRAAPLRHVIYVGVRIVFLLQVFSYLLLRFVSFWSVFDWQAV